MYDCSLPDGAGIQLAQSTSTGYLLAPAMPRLALPLMVNITIMMIRYIYYKYYYKPPDHAHGLAYEHARSGKKQGSPAEQCRLNTH